MQLIKSIQLSDKELKAMEVLPVSEKGFIMALTGSKICILSKEEAVSFIYEILKVSEMDSGLTKIENKDLVALGFTTYDLIKDRYQNLTTNEFTRACKEGVIEDGWYGMCLKTVNQWIKTYVNKELRLKAIKNWNLQIEKSETSDKPIIDKIFFSKRGCENAFQRYKDLGLMPAGAFAYYDFINDLIGIEYKGRKTLIDDLETRKKIIKQTTHEYTNKLLQAKVFEEKKGNMNLSEALMSIVASNFENDIGLINLQKGYFLKHFFNELIKQNKNLIFNE